MLNLTLKQHVASLYIYIYIYIYINYYIDINLNIPVVSSLPLVAIFINGPACNMYEYIVSY